VARSLVMIGLIAVLIAFALIDAVLAVPAAPATERPEPGAAMVPASIAGAVRAQQGSGEPPGSGLTRDAG
jgi:hypothetical protein